MISNYCDPSDRQEMYHWGIKGQKWGVRRFQNEDGSLTEEGKKRYMYAARHNKLNYKKLSDDDLDMINRRFSKEAAYKKNVAEYEQSTFSYKLKKAALDRIRGNGGGGGEGGGKKGKGGKRGGIGALLAMPIEQAFKDAFGSGNKKENDKGNDNENENRNKENNRDDGPNYSYISRYDPRPEKLKRDIERGRQAVQESVNRWNSSHDDSRWNSFNTGGKNSKNTRSENVLRTRSKSHITRQQEQIDQRYVDRLFNDGYGSEW